MRNAGLKEAQAGIKISGRNINNLRYADDTTVMTEREELKSLLMKVKDSGNSVRLYFWGAPQSLQIVVSAMKLKDTYSLEGKLCPI